MTKQNHPEIRPSSVFRELEIISGYASNSMLSIIPTADIGSTTMIEKAILVALIKIVNPLSIFEFGTFRGETSHLFLENTSDNVKVYTCDLPSPLDQNKNLGEYNILNAAENDQYLTHFRHNNLIPAFLSSIKKNKNRFTQISCNSMSLDTNALPKFDFIFVDGGHTPELVFNDTQKAFRMLSSKGVIVWHDYNSPIHTAVTDFIDNFVPESPYRIFTIKGTSLAISVDSDLLAKFLQ